ncbi:MAG: AI-2E family transporter [Candidatus Obscuribacterales bacterium]|nr:AI-2E family transporter [Candidatus Obscuribacterales bacterium]
MNEAERLLIFQRQLVITVLLLLLLALIILIGFFFGDILRILGIALVLSYMVINIVDWLEKSLKNRALAVAFVYVTMLAILGISALLVLPVVIVQIGQLLQTTFNAIPEALQKLTQMLEPLEHKFRAYQIDIKAVDIINNVIANMPKPDPSILVSRVSDVAMGTMTWLLYWISISVVTFYFLLDGYKITDSLIHLFPLKQQGFLRAVATDADKSLQSFFRGQLVLGIAFGIVMLVVYTTLGVQYALLLSVFLAVMEIMPVIGPPIGFFPAILSVAFHGMNTPGNKIAQVIILSIIFTALQQFKDNLVAPKYIGNVIGLHPIMIFIAIMVGARLDGTLGIIFALPVACVANVFFTHLHKTWFLEQTENPSSTVDNSSNPPALSPQEEA